MDKLISCEFNIDTASVELKYADGDMVSIYCPRVEECRHPNAAGRTGLAGL